MKIDTSSDLGNLVCQDSSLLKRYTSYGICFGDIDVSFRGEDHMTFRFKSEYNLEPMRIKKGSSMIYDINNGLIIINDKVAIKIK